METLSAHLQQQNDPHKEQGFLQLFQPLPLFYLCLKQTGFQLG